MIYFQTKPDAVFEAILKEAFTSEASEIQLLSDDGAIDSWEGLYPETSQRLCPYEAVRVLVQLLAAVNDSQVYRLTDLHWLVLYETLKNFCATHNDLLDDFDQHTRPVGDYNIGKWMERRWSTFIFGIRTFSCAIEKGRGATGKQATFVNGTMLERTRRSRIQPSLFWNPSMSLAGS